MSKKAQVTLFIILGIILVAAIVLGLVLSNEFSKTESQDEIALVSSLPPDMREVRKQVDSCSQFVLEEAILEAGRYAGYNSPLENALEVDGTYVNYGKLRGDEVLPEISLMEEEIATYMDTFIPDCANLESFDLELESKQPRTEVDINEGKVIAETDYEIIITKEDAEFKLDDPYFSEAEVKFRPAVDAAKEIISQEDESENDVDISHLLELGWDVDVVPVDERNVVYSIKDNENLLESPEGKKNFAYVFAVEVE